MQLSIPSRRFALAGLNLAATLFVCPFIVVEAALLEACASIVDQRAPRLRVTLWRFLEGWA